MPLSYCIEYNIIFTLFTHIRCTHNNKKINNTVNDNKHLSRSFFFSHLSCFECAIYLLTDRIHAHVQIQYDKQFYCTLHSTASHFLNVNIY